MERLNSRIVLLGMVISCACCTVQSLAFERDAKIVAKVETLLEQMTLDEKVGQLGQLDINYFRQRTWQASPLDLKKMETAIEAMLEYVELEMNL